jgi:uncharacterized cofD-like protein
VGLRRIENFPKIVVLGGSSAPCLIADGLSREKRRNLTAIVATTDTGSSTGIIRSSFSIPAPGDLRCVISKMSGLKGHSAFLKELFEYRIRQDRIKDLNGMAFGNLFIATLSEFRGDFGLAVEETCRLLRVVGRVLPVTCQKATLAAILEDGRVVLGEKDVRSPGKGRIKKLYIYEDSIYTTRECIDAISKADLIVIGPGCLYTSTIACLIVGGIREAIYWAKGKKVYICNTTTTPGQTDGMRIIDHVKEVIKYLGEGVLHWVIINDKRPPEDMIRTYREEGVHFMDLHDEERKEIARIGPEPIYGDFIERRWKGIRHLHKKDTIRHDPKRVVNAILRLLCILILLVIWTTIPFSAFSQETPRKPPPRLIDEKGSFKEGWYSSPIKDVNIDDARFEEGSEGENLFRTLRKKRFLLCYVDCKDLLVKIRLSDAGYIGEFLYLVYEKEKKDFISYRVRPFFSHGVTISSEGIEGISKFVNERATITFLNDDTRKQIEINGLISGDRERPSILSTLIIRYGSGNIDPLVLVRRLPGGRVQYWHRVGATSLAGRFIIGGRGFSISRKDSFAFLSYEAGYPLFRTNLKRAFAWGQSIEGDRVAIDLTLHKDGDIEGESPFYWINGKIFRAKGLRMDIEGGNGPLKIFTSDKRIHLLFYSERSYKEDFNLGPVEYHEVETPGWFRGELKDPKGIEYKVKGIFGLFQQWRSKW